MAKRRKLPKEPEKEEGIASALVRKGAAPCKYYISTGSLLLDLAISDRYPGGGIGSGRITHIYGDNSTAKSVIAQEVIGDAQRKGGSGVYEDAEATLDFPRARALFGMTAGDWEDQQVRDDCMELATDKVVGICPNFIYRVPASIEGIFDDEIMPVCKLIGSGKLPGPCAMAIDTFSALPSEAELKAKLVEGTYGTSRAKQMSAAFRKYIRGIEAGDLTILAVDQTREAIGRQFGPKHCVSGGRAMQFYASTRILLKTAGRVKNAHGRVIGVDIKAIIEKNKIAPPHREASFRILFDYGIDNIASNLLWLKENATEEKIECKLTMAGSWWKWEGEGMGQGEQAACKFIEDKSLEQQLDEELVRVWRIVHTPPDRKARER